MVLFGAAELMSRVPEWLKTAGLAPFIPNFNNCEEDEFLGLQVYPVPFQSRKRKTAMTAVLFLRRLMKCLFPAQMQDYANFNITSQEDRRKLFSLLQVLKRELDSPKPSGGMKALPAKKNVGGGPVPRSANQPIPGVPLRDKAITSGCTMHLGA